MGLPSLKSFSLGADDGQPEAIQLAWLGRKPPKLILVLAAAVASLVRLAAF
jgi:hypothetical protein